MSLSAPTLALALAVIAAPSPQLYAERIALLAADARCGLLSPMVRAGVEAGAAIARGQLLRGGSSAAETDRLAAQAQNASAARACEDPAIQAAAASAKAGYAAWSRTHEQRFAGRHAAWTARRTPDPAGWILWQTPAGSPDARIGLNASGDGPAFALAAPDGGRRFAAAQIAFRDPDRTQALLDVPGRAAPDTLDLGLSPPDSRIVHAARARVRAPGSGPAQTVFVFPDAAFVQLQRLDPRETALILLLGADGRAAGRILVEVGDLAAARAFLAARPE